MVLFLNSSAKKNIIRKIQKHFRALSWRIENVATYPTDLYVSKGALRIPILVLDKSLNNFRSPTDIIQRIENDTQEIKAKSRRTLTVVVDWQLGQVSYDKLSARGLTVLFAHEIDLISQCEYILASGKEVNDPRQLRMLQGNLDACREVSIKFADQKNFEAAIRWAEIAVSCTSGFNSSYQLLHAILLRSGRQDDADKFAERAADLKPSEIYFVRAMIDRSVRHEDKSEEDRWQRRLKEALDNKGF